MEHVREHGVAATIPFDLFNPDGIDFALISFTIGDVKISKDGGAFVNVASFPTALLHGYLLNLSAAEMTANNIVVSIIDGSATKLWLDTTVKVATSGTSTTPIKYDLESKYNGAIHYSSTGSPGSVIGRNGTIDNPANSVTDVDLLLAAKGLNKIVVHPNDTLVLTTDSAYREIDGFGYRLSLNNQNIVGMTVRNSANVFGTASAGGQSIPPGGPKFIDCVISDLTIPNITAFIRCTFIPNTVVTVSESGLLDLINCYHTGSGSTSLNFDTVGVAGNKQITLSGCSGDYTVSNMGASDQFFFYGTGTLVINSNNTALTGFITISDGIDIVDLVAGGYKGTITQGVTLNNTIDIQNRLPASLLVGRMDSSVGASIPVDLNASQTGVTIGTVNTLTGHTPQTADHTANISNIQSRVPAALVGGKIDANVGSIAGGSISPSNLDSTYNGLGYTDPQAPATQQQIGNIANVGSAINKEASAFTLTTGTVASGTFADTLAVDGVAHIINDVAGVTDVFYTFDIGSQGVPSTVGITAISNGGNDDLNIVGWDWGSSTWIQIGLLSGKNSSTAFDVITASMFTGMVGTGINSGMVRVGFQGTGLTTATLRVDQIFVAFSNNKSVTGYESGKVWVDTVNGTTGAVADVNGVADLPVNNWADAQIISGIKNISRYNMGNGSIIVLTSSIANRDLTGEEWDISLNSQDISEATIHGATVNGIGIGALTPEFEHCKFGNITINGGMVRETGLMATVTIGAANTLTFDRCHSMVPGTGSPILDFGLTIGATGVNFRSYSGGIDIRNMGQGAGSDNLSLEGFGHLIIGSDVNPANSTIVVRGSFKITDNVPGGFIAGGGTLDLTANHIPLDTGTVGDITASTSGTSFTISNIVNSKGGAVTLATDMFAGQILKATTRTGQVPSNVLDEEVMIESVTAGGLVTVKINDISGAGFSATPNTVTTSFKLL